MINNRTDITGIFEEKLKKEKKLKKGKQILPNYLLQYSALPNHIHWFVSCKLYHVVQTRVKKNVKLERLTEDIDKRRKKPKLTSFFCKI